MNVEGARCNLANIGILARCLDDSLIAKCEKKLISAFASLSLREDFVGYRGEFRLVFGIMCNQLTKLLKSERCIARRIAPLLQPFPKRLPARHWHLVRSRFPADLHRLMERMKHWPADYVCQHWTPLESSAAGQRMGLLSK